MLARAQRRRPQQLWRRNGALAQHVWLRAREVEHGGGHAARRRPAIHHRHHSRQLGVGGGHRGFAPVQVGAGRHQRPRRTQQVEGHLVLGDAHPKGPSALGIEDQGQRAGPPAPHHRLRSRVDMDEALELRLRGHHEDQREPNGPAFDVEHATRGDLIVRSGAQAVDRVGREGDHSPAPDQLSRAGQTRARRFQKPGAPRTHADGSEFVGMEDHASRTRWWPARSLWIRWPAKWRFAPSIAIEAMDGSSSASARPPAFRRPGASASNRVTSADPWSSANRARAGWATTSGASAEPAATYGRFAQTRSKKPTNGAIRSPHTSSMRSDRPWAVTFSAATSSASRATSEATTWTFGA